MSDDDRPAGPSKGDSDELGLPQAPINKLIQEHLPDGMAATKDVKQLIADACREFVVLLASEANELADKDSKKTMMPEHIAAALKVRARFKQLVKHMRCSVAAAAFATHSRSISLIHAQSLGFDGHVAEVEAAAGTHQTAAKDRTQKKASRFNKSGMTEEELIAAQDALMAESAAKMAGR